MTKVELHYDLAAPADEALMNAIDRAHSVYGIQSVRLANSLDSIAVTYDASRLKRDDVEDVLRRAGLAIRPKTAA
jgi:hypothetical protein